MVFDGLQTSHEVTQIERESRGAVEFTVLRETGFDLVLDGFHRRFRFREVNAVLCLNLFVSIHSPQALHHYVR